MDIVPMSDLLQMFQNVDKKTVTREELAKRIQETNPEIYTKSFCRMKADRAIRWWISTGQRPK